MLFVFYVHTLKQTFMSLIFYSNDVSWVSISSQYSNIKNIKKSDKQTDSDCSSAFLKQDKNVTFQSPHKESHYKAVKKKAN